MKKILLLGLLFLLPSASAMQSEKKIAQLDTAIIEKLQLLQDYAIKGIVPEGKDTLLNKKYNEMTNSSKESSILATKHNGVKFLVIFDSCNAPSVYSFYELSFYPSGYLPILTPYSVSLEQAEKLKTKLEEELIA